MRVVRLGDFYRYFENGCKQIHRIHNGWLSDHRNVRPSILVNKVLSSPPDPYNRNCFKYLSKSNRIVVPITARSKKWASSMSSYFSRVTNSFASHSFFITWLKLTKIVSSQSPWHRLKFSINRFGPTNWIHSMLIVNNLKLASFSLGERKELAKLSMSKFI